MKKLFDFTWLTARFFKPRRRHQTRVAFGRFETLQLRTVPAAIASLPIDETSSEELAQEDVVEMEVTDEEFVGDEFVTFEDAEGELSEEIMFMAFSSFGSSEGEESFEVATGDVVEEGSEEFVEVTAVDGEVPEEWMYFSVPLDEPIQDEFEVVTLTAFEDGGEVIEDDVVIEDEVIDGQEKVEITDSGESGEIVDRGSDEGEIKPYYRTLTGVVTTSEETVSDESSVDDSTSEDVVFKGDVVDGEAEVVDGEVVDNPEIFYTLGSVPSVDGGEDVLNPEIFETQVVNDEVVDGEVDPDIVFQTTGGPVDDLGGGGGEEVVVTTTSDDSEGDPEIRTLNGAAEVTTYEGLVGLCVEEIAAAGESFSADLQTHIGDFTQLVGLITSGLQQNSQDIAAFAAVGDTAGIQSEIAQNEALIAQLTQLVTTYVNGITELHQTYVGRLGVANEALSQGAANPAGINTAAAAFSSSRLAARPAFGHDLGSYATDLQALLDSQNGNDEGGEGFAPDESLPAGDEGLGQRIRPGNSQVTAAVSEIGLTSVLTGDVASVTQPEVGETVTVAVNYWSTDDTLGDELVYVSSVSGNVVLTGTDGGADITGGKLTIDGLHGDNPFSFTVDVPADAADTASFDENGHLVGLTGSYSLPATEGLLPTGGTLVVNVTVTPLAE